MELAFIIFTVLADVCIFAALCFIGSLVLDTHDMLAGELYPFLYEQEDWEGRWMPKETKRKTAKRS